MKPGHLTALVSALVERNLVFVGKLTGDTTTVGVVLPVVQLNPQAINGIATKLANAAFKAVPGKRLAFEHPKVVRDRVVIEVGEHQPIVVKPPVVERPAEEPDFSVEPVRPTPDLRRRTVRPVISEPGDDR